MRSCTFSILLIQRNKKKKQTEHRQIQTIIFSTKFSQRAGYQTLNTSKNSKYLDQEGKIYTMRCW